MASEMMNHSDQVGNTRLRAARVILRWPPRADGTRVLSLVFSSNQFNRFGAAKSTPKPKTHRLPRSRGEHPRLAINGSSIYIFYQRLPSLSAAKVQLLGRSERQVNMKVFIFAVLCVLSVALYSQQSQPKRVGMIIGIKPDKISAYEALHAASNQGVRDLLDKYHMNNFSIYIQKLDESHYYLFAYYEYTGNDYKKDMDTMAKEPRNIKWLSVTDAMQIPFPGQTSWTKMQEVFHNP
jgi:L-rhamnose mutarotase